MNTHVQFPGALDARSKAIESITDALSLAKPEPNQVKLQDLLEFMGTLTKAKVISFLWNRTQY